MARRKRLSPAAALTDTPEVAPETKSAARPPIASVVADAAGQAALGEVAAEYAAARRDGRLVATLPLDAIDGAHLVRDRLVSSNDDMETLKASIKARGQQTPIEVEDLGDGRLGLISGWRRLEALRQLHRETGDDQFARIKALIRSLETVSDAYVAMVEENEIRANLSFYERARIADRAAERGIYPTAEIAVRELFRHASRPKRSKILSFLRLYRTLKDVLKFPTALSERRGLALARALDDDPKAETRIRAELEAVAPETPEEEATALFEAMEGVAFFEPSLPRGAAPAKPKRALPEGIRIKTGEGRIELTGTGVDDDFAADLKDWVSQRNRY